MKMTLIPDLTRQIHELFKTRTGKLQDAWDTLTMRRTQLDRAEQQVLTAEKFLNRCIDEFDLAEVKQINAIAELERVQHWTQCGSIHWLVTSPKRLNNAITFQELKEYILAEGIDADAEFMHQLDYCIDHPEDVKGEFKDYKAR